MDIDGTPDIAWEAPSEPGGKIWCLVRRMKTVETRLRLGPPAQRRKPLMANVEARIAGVAVTVQQLAG